MKIPALPKSIQTTHKWNLNYLHHPSHPSYNVQKLPAILGHNLFETANVSVSN
jgi:hypothetical protein